MDTYTQRVHVKKIVHEVDFGTCRTEGCVMEGMTLSDDTWHRLMTDRKLRKNYGLKHVAFNLDTGVKR